MTSRPGGGHLPVEPGAARHNVVAPARRGIDSRFAHAQA